MNLQFKHIEPLTDTARSFFEAYGGLFSLEGGFWAGHPVVRLRTTTGERIIVEKHNNGDVLVNGQLFGRWSDEN